jgi:two-component system response regulator AtoC
MSDAASVLVVDDDEAVGKVLAALLVQDGLRATWVGSAEAALATLEKKPYDLVLSDVRMPGFSGLELLKMTRLKWEDMPVILITAHGTVPMAVEAMREGAADFMLKPFQRDEVIYVVRKALAGSEKARSAPPRPGRGKVESTDGMVGTSPAIEELRQLVRKIAPSTATALVLGETGTGKELAARALHSLSPRKDKPFVAVNCSAFTETLFESELFGHEKGAFTGAERRKAGRVELAEGGTLLLDEIGELSPTLQVKLLRLIQEKTFERVGGTEPLKAEVRIVAATHRNLGEMVKAGTFREDLFYRLNVVPITSPPLRDRPGDIEPLVRHFLASFGPANGRPKAALTPGSMGLLVAQKWPGNVRQLQNFIERLVVLAPEGDLIEEATVKLELERMGLNAKDPGTGNGEAGGAPAADSLPERRKDAERQAVEEALKKARGNRSVAARILGVSRRTLYNKLESLGLTEI